MFQSTGANLFSRRWSHIRRSFGCERRLPLDDPERRIHASRSNVGVFYSNKFAGCSLALGKSDMTPHCFRHDHREIAPWPAREPLKLRLNVGNVRIRRAGEQVGPQFRGRRINPDYSGFASASSSIQIEPAISNNSDGTPDVCVLAPTPKFLARSRDNIAA